MYGRAPGVLVGRYTERSHGVAQRVLIAMAIRFIEKRVTRELWGALLESMKARRHVGVRGGTLRVLAYTEDK